MKVVGMAKVTSNGQITIPKNIREELNLKDGDYLLFLKDAQGKFYVAKEVEIK